ncbi:single hybrid motif-containing protein [Mycena polygramma]|nr:single hybrid motif-containing protein [Mycena polygramma]
MAGSAKVKELAAFHNSSVKRAILMPSISPFMTQCTISRWVKKEGDAFRAGDVLLEIESEYHTIGVEAQNPGVLGKILSPDGSTNVPVEQVIALATKTPQEMVSHAHMPPPPPPLAASLHHHSYLSPRGVGLEHAKVPMTVSSHRTPSFEMRDAAHSTGPTTIRGLVMDHAGPQHMPAPEPSVQPPSPNESVDPGGSNESHYQAAVIRKTIVSGLSRQRSGSKSSDEKKCATAQYFDGIL